MTTLTTAATYAAAAALGAAAAAYALRPATDHAEPPPAPALHDHGHAHPDIGRFTSTGLEGRTIYVTDTATGDIYAVAMLPTNKGSVSVHIGGPSWTDPNFHTSVIPHSGAPAPIGTSD